MENFLMIQLQAGLCMIGFYTLYFLLLKSETHFSTNRVFLMISLLVSFVLPLPDLHFGSTESGSVYGMILKPLTITAGNITEFQQNHLTVLQLFTIFYYVGFILMSLRLIFRFTQLFRLIAHQPHQTISGMRLIETDQSQATFSFFHIVFLSKHYQTTEKEGILAHEKIHVKQLHSLDILIIELVSLFQWFNPVVWFYKRSIRETHEFLADQGALHQGIDKSEYLQLLLQAAGVLPLNSIVHTFSQYPLKTRIMMMTKPKSASWSQLRVLLALPLFLLMAFFFSCSHTPEKSASAIEQTLTAEADTIVFMVVEEMPEFNGGTDAMVQFLTQNIVYPATAKEKGIQGKVFVSFVVGANGKIDRVKIQRSVESELDAEAYRVVSSMPDWKPGKQGGKAVNVQLTLPISFKLS